MVKRRTNKRSGRRVAGGSRMYKKCIVAVIRRTKFKTPKMARKAFGKASKICRKKLPVIFKKTFGVVVGPPRPPAKTVWPGGNLLAAPPASVAVCARTSAAFYRMSSTASVSRTSVQ